MVIILVFLYYGGLWFYYVSGVWCCFYLNLLLEDWIEKMGF